jgi:hypothetical protein
MVLRTGELQVVGESFEPAAPYPGAEHDDGGATVPYDEPPVRPMLFQRHHDPEPTLVHPITRRKIPRPANTLPPPPPASMFRPPPSEPRRPAFGGQGWGLQPMGAPPPMFSEPPPVAMSQHPSGHAPPSRTLVVRGRPTAWWAMALVMVGMCVGFVVTVLSDRTVDPVVDANASAPQAAQPPAAQPPVAQPPVAQQQPVAQPAAQPPPQTIAPQAAPPPPGTQPLPDTRPVLPATAALALSPPPVVAPPPRVAAPPQVAAPSAAVGPVAHAAPSPVKPVARPQARAVPVPVARPVRPIPTPLPVATSVPKRATGGAPTQDDDLSRARREVGNSL